MDSPASMPHPSPVDAYLTAGYAGTEAAAVGQALRLALATQRPATGITAARILHALHADAPTLQAALLVDAGLDPKTLAADFGPRVAGWVERVGRLESRPFPPEHLGNPRREERWRRLLLALANGVPPLLIVLARRLETLRRQARAPDAVAQRDARETLAIHAPLASRLGVHQLKWQLEDVAFRILEPATYRELAARLAATRRARENLVEAIRRRLTEMLEAAGYRAQVQGRPKHLYSIWRKMQRKQVGMEELYDLHALRVITATVSDCYAILALVHDRWQPLPAEYDDYIARPKDNGYQSLHTVVQGPERVPVEIQIRTEAMHELAEYGMAAHWRYKEGGERDRVLERTVAALRRSLQTGSGGEDWFAGQIFVLTPKREVVRLPAGATPVDFAYAVHTDVGHRCRGARVDGRIVPLNYRLKNGEQVEILTAKGGAPNLDWLDFVRSDHARQRIRRWFRQREAEIHRRIGRRRLERECCRLGLRQLDWPRLLHRFQCHRPEELWLAIGRGAISRGQLLTVLRALFAPSESAGPSPRGQPRQSPSRPAAPALRVQGEHNLLTRLARCCDPAPGDAVIGYLTVHHHIAIHRRDCHNIVNLPPERRRRLLEVDWK